MSGKRKYDTWTILTVGILCLYVLFMFYPLFQLFLSSVFDAATGSFSLKYFAKFFSKRYYINTIFNSLKVTVCVTALSILIATPLAYIMQTVRIRFSGSIRVLILLTSMSAPFIGAYSWILMLGNNGAITNFFRNTFSIEIPTIYGFGGIVLVLTLQLVPLVFMYVSGVLKNVDNSLLEAAENMNCTGIRKVLTVVVPLITPTILAAGILVFMRALADFGTPMLIGEGFRTVPVLIYYEYMGEVGGEDGFAAAISMLVVLFALLAYGLQKVVSSRLSFSMTALNPIEPKQVSGWKNIAAHGVVYAYMLVALLPQMSILVSSFRNTSGMVFTEGFGLKSYLTAFGKMSTAIKNTVLFASIAIVFVVFIAVIVSYAAIRRKNVITSSLDVVTMMPYIVPGSILGIALATAFNKNPFVLTGTVTIMIISFVIKRLPYTIRSSSAILHNIDPSVEEASLNLGANGFTTFFQVTLPMMFSGIFSGAVMSFITIITELSSTVLLYTARTITMTAAIYAEVIRGNYGVASALSVMLSVLTILLVSIAFKVTGKKELSI